MIYTYFSPCDFLREQDIYDKALGSLSYYRQEAVHKCKTESDKYRSLCAGLLLSFALFLHCGLRECELIYGFGENGQPYLPHYPDIQFNISHSGNMALLSIGDKPNGADVEKIRKVNKKIAKKYFNDEEKEYAVTDEKFLEIWTLKEAVLKAAGMGIFGNLREFAINPKAQKTLYNNNTYFFTQHKISDYIFSVSSQSDKIMPPNMADLHSYLKLL